MAIESFYASFAPWYGAAAPGKPYSITPSETAPGLVIFGCFHGEFFPIDGALMGNYAYGQR